MKTKTIRLEETVYHDLHQGTDLRRMPIRVMVDFMGELAITALSVGVNERWGGQESYSSQSGDHVVKMSDGVYQRLDKLCKKIGLNVSTAIHEVFYARRTELMKVRGLQMHELVHCRNACHASRMRYNEARP